MLLLYHKVGVHLEFLEIVNHFQELLSHFTFTPEINEGLLSLPAHQHLVLFIILTILVSVSSIHCGFNLSFPSD